MFKMFKMFIMLKCFKMYKYLLESFFLMAYIALYWLVSVYISCLTTLEFQYHSDIFECYWKSNGVWHWNSNGLKFYNLKFFGAWLC